jgi:hypothetical protein
LRAEASWKLHAARPRRQFDRYGWKSRIGFHQANRPRMSIGEVGLHKNTRNEVCTLPELIELGVKRDEQMLFHTPHSADKYQGTQMILDLLRGDTRMDRSRVCIDHCEEHTIRSVLDRGYGKNFSFASCGNAYNVRSGPG